MTAIPAFTYDAPSRRVLFGVGARQRVAAEIERLGVERALLVRTAGRSAEAAELAGILGDRVAGVFDAARQHVPEVTLELGRTAAAQAGTDGYITIGGGSAVGVAKALARESGLPILAVPTTYAGSEMTPVWGVTRQGRKATGRDERVLPRTVIYDPELTLSLPPRLAGPSGLNAIAHCVGALGASDGNPLTSLLAEDGVRLLASALPAIKASPLDLEARSEALLGACVAGMALAAVSMGLQHRLAHLLGGTFGLSHAESHAVLLPHVLARERVPEAAYRRLMAALGAPNPAAALQALAAASGAPRALREIGLAEEALENVVQLAAEVERSDGSRLGASAARDLLNDAFSGRDVRDRGNSAEAPGKNA